MQQLILDWEDTAIKHTIGGMSLMVQWLGLCASTAGGVGSIPGQGTKILKAMQHGQKKKKTKPNQTKKTPTWNVTTD